MSEPNSPADPTTEESEPTAMAARTEDGRIVVVTPNGMAVEGPPSYDADSDEEAAEQRSAHEMVEQPAKVMRIGTMIRHLLEEVKGMDDLDEAARERLRDIQAAAIQELSDGLAPELVEELNRLASPFTSEEPPSGPELRIAQAQLVGWLEGLFQGIQTALVAQQMAARAQLEQMRRALPPGATPGGPQGASDQPRRTDGMYL
jgi:hypothetical protein